MALVSRTRRSSARWWLAAGIVATLLVLLVDASIKSRSPAPIRTLASQAWVDRVLPVVTQTNQQGAEINNIRSSGLSMTASSINSQLQQVAAAAHSSLATVQGLNPPANVAGANGLLIACLQTRAQAAAAFQAAMDKVLTGPKSAAAAEAPALTSAVEQFQVSDQAYHLFVQDVPPLGVTMPASSWYTNPAAFAQPGLTTFLQALRAKTNAVPVHSVGIAALSTSPGALSSHGNVQVLPPASLVSVNVTVADSGNQTESQVPVSASFSPSAAGYLGSARQFVSLSPGQDVALTVGTLKAPTNVPVTLTVTVGPVPGQSTAATKTLVFQMP